MYKKKLIMFKCPKCRNKLINFKCEKCSYEIPIHNGVIYFCEEENINVNDEGHKYVGYDDINIHFSTSLIYWGLGHYGIYGSSAEDIVKRYGKGIVVSWFVDDVLILLKDGLLDLIFD